MVFKSQEQGPMVNYPDFIQISDKDSYYSDDFLQFNDYESDTDSTTDDSEIISLSDMEDIILIHPSVEKVVVVRSPKGQLRAFVVLRRGYEDEKAEDIRSFVDDQVQPQNQLRGGLYIMTNLKRNLLTKEAASAKAEDINTDNLQLPPPAAAA